MVKRYQAAVLLGCGSLLNVQVAQAQLPASPPAFRLALAGALRDDAVLATRIQRQQDLLPENLQQILQEYGEWKVANASPK